MSSFSDAERAREWLFDIVEYADRIAAYIDGRSFEEFCLDAMLRDAVYHCVLIITEAAVRLGPERMSAIDPQVQVHELRGMGNVLRHDYRRINAALMWNTVTQDVPALRTACAAALAEE